MGTPGLPQECERLDHRPRTKPPQIGHRGPGHLPAGLPRGGGLDPRSSGRGIHVLAHGRPTYRFLDSPRSRGANPMNRPLFNGRVTIRMAQHRVHIIALTEHSIATSTTYYDEAPPLQSIVTRAAGTYQENNGYFRPAIAICGDKFATYDSRASGAAILGQWTGGLPRYVITRRRQGELDEPNFLPNLLYLA